MQVYYNLHKKCLSVTNRKGIVIGYCDRITLRDVEFFVSEPGRQRVLKEKRKNVHAKVRGYVAGESSKLTEPRSVRYNPYLFETFVYSDTEKPIHQSDMAVVDGTTVLAA